MMRAPRVAVTLAALLWVVAIVLTPAIAPGPRAGPGPALAVAGVYVAGAFVCHQRPERSLFVAGRQMPVCARCAGVYISALAGLIWALRPRTRRPPTPSARRAMLAAAAAPSLGTLVVEWSGLVQPGNVGRFVAALPLGAALGWLIGQMLGEQ